MAPPPTRSSNTATRSKVKLLLGRLPRKVEVDGIPGIGRFWYVSRASSKRTAFCLTAPNRVVQIHGCRILRLVHAQARHGVEAYGALDGLRDWNAE